MTPTSKSEEVKEDVMVEPEVVELPIAKVTEDTMSLRRLFGRTEVSHIAKEDRIAKVAEEIAEPGEDLSVKKDTKEVAQSGVDLSVAEIVEVPVTSTIQKELEVEELAWDNDDVFLAEDLMPRYSDLMEMTGREIAQCSHRPSLRPPRRRRLPYPAKPWEGAMTLLEAFSLF